MDVQKKRGRKRKKTKTTGHEDDHQPRRHDKQEEIGRREDHPLTKYRQTRGKGVNSAWKIVDQAGCGPEGFLLQTSDTSKVRRNFLLRARLRNPFVSSLATARKKHAKKVLKCLRLYNRSMTKWHTVLLGVACTQFPCAVPLAGFNKLATLPPSCLSCCSFSFKTDVPCPPLGLFP